MREQILDALMENKIIAIVRGQRTEDMLRLAGALYEGGIRFMEVTFRQDAPETWQETAAAIRSISHEYAGKIFAGAGTVMRPEQLELARAAGAGYIISPNADEEIIRLTRSMGLVSLPGAFTPTEIAAAYKWGADAVKVFPAGALGPGYLKAVLAPLRHIPMMAVGGVDENNAADFIAAGAIGVGVGGNLVNSKWIAEGQFNRITALAAEYVRAVGAGKK